MGCVRTNIKLMRSECRLTVDQRDRSGLHTSFAINELFENASTARASVIGVKIEGPHSEEFPPSHVILTCSDHRFILCDKCLGDDRAQGVIERSIIYSPIAAC